jgi:16S rRNA (cytosine1407-C5)-methyltransferase
VYSTCTLALEEDEGVLDALLKKYPGSIEIKDLKNRLPAPAPGLPSDGVQNFDPAVVSAARLWPHRFGTSGFFAALIQKTGPTPGPVQEPPSRPFVKSGFNALSNREVLSLADLWHQAYEVDLVSLIEIHSLQLFRRQEIIYALPRLYIERFSWLPCQAAGLELGEEVPGALLPAHDWVTRFFKEFKGSRFTLSDEMIPVWMRGGDILDINPGILPKGSLVLVVDAHGNLLGRGKLLSDRIKNLLPRRLVQ